MRVNDPTLLKLTPSILKVTCPQQSATALEGWIDPIRQAGTRYGILGPKHVAAFIAQISHESAGLTKLAEDLNYSAARLRAVWPRRFPSDAIAAAYARQPIKLANYVYANRNGNGNEASGDGYRFRGQGPLQVTGRDNHTMFAGSVNMPLAAATEWMQSPAGGMMSAAWFWSVHGINALVDTPGEEDETRAVNGGLEGLAERKAFYHALLGLLS